MSQLGLFSKRSLFVLLVCTLAASARKNLHAADAPAPKLVIVKAVYGDLPDGMKTDVTAKVAGLVKDDAAGPEFNPGSSALVCSSSSNPVILWSFDQTWRQTVWSNYMYMGGLSQATKLGASVAYWGKVAPAVKQSEDDATDHVLAGDETYWVANINHAQFSGGLSSRINHQDKYFATPRPAYENIPYADGHVSALTKDDDPQGLGLLAPLTWSVTTSANGPLWYWNGKTSAFP